VGHVVTSAKNRPLMLEKNRKTWQFICKLQCLFGAFYKTWKTLGKHVSFYCLFINYNAYLEPFLKLTLLVRPVGTPGKKSASGVVKKIGKHVGSNVYL
jgi:hypothetical protein